MSNTVSIKDLLTSPDYFAYDLQVPELNFIFKQVSRKSYLDSAFLDMRTAHTTGMQYQLPFNQCVNELKKLSPQTAQTAYIFHTSFCCSTLLARCFESLSGVFALKEPWLLRRLSDMKRQKVHMQAIPEPLWQDIVFSVEALYRKSYQQKNIVIKPTNLANNLISELMAKAHKPKAVLLYSSLEEFLVSCLKKDADTQAKMGLLAKMFVRDAGGHAKISLDEIQNLPMLKASVLCWAAQFKMIIKQCDKQRLNDMLFLTSQALLARPVDTVTQLYQFFNFGELPEDYLEALNVSLNRNAKATDIRYSAETKKAEYQKVYDQHKTDIQDALSWSEKYIDIAEIDAFLAAAPRVNFE